MQTPEERKALIQAGLYHQLEAPEHIGFGKPVVAVQEKPMTEGQKKFKHTVDEVFSKDGD